MTRKERKTFAETLAEVRATPARAARVPSGHHGDCWGDQEGNRYDLVTDELSADDAVQLARDGAVVVYDECGCGGSGCDLDWLSDDEARRVAEAGTPDLHPSKHGRANLEHWRSADGRDLVVAAGEVSWGDRITG